MKHSIKILLFASLLYCSCRKENEEILCRGSIIHKTFSCKIMDKKTGKVIGLDLADSIIFKEDVYPYKNYYYEFNVVDSSFYFYMYDHGNDTIFLKFKQAERYDTLFPIYDILRDKCNNAIPKLYYLFHNGVLLKENIIRL